MLNNCTFITKIFKKKNYFCFCKMQIKELIVRINLQIGLTFAFSEFNLFAYQSYDKI